MLNFHILTIFPEMFDSFCKASICKRAIENGKVAFFLHNYRDYTLDKHKRVDDAPFGGGAGMLIAPQSVCDCFASIKSHQIGKKVINLYMSASGMPFCQQMAEQLAAYEEINVLCGHYEGVDQRIIDTHIDLEVSIGDYVLTGGELPAMVLADAVMRYIPGVLGNEQSTQDESFSYDGLLEYPQYTRPADFRGLQVPEILLSGHHANIRAWQRRRALEKTALVRPDLLQKAKLTPQERREFLQNLLPNNLN